MCPNDRANPLDRRLEINIALAIANERLILHLSKNFDTEVEIRSEPKLDVSGRMIKIQAIKHEYMRLIEAEMVLLPLNGIRGLEFCMILEIIHGLAVSALRFELTSPFYDCRSDEEVISIKVSLSLRNLYAS